MNFKKCNKHKTEKSDYCPTCKIDDITTKKDIEIASESVDKHKEKTVNRLGEFVKFIIYSFIVFFFLISFSLMSAGNTGYEVYIFYFLAALFSVFSLRSFIYVVAPTKKLEKLTKKMLTILVSIIVVIIYFGPLVADYIKYDIGNEERYPSLEGQVDKDRVLITKNAFVSRKKKDLKIFDTQFINGIIFSNINDSYMYYNNAGDNLITGTIIFDKQGSDNEFVILEIYESIWSRIWSDSPVQGKLYESFKLYNNKPVNMSLDMTKYYTGSGSIMFNIKSESSNNEGRVIIGDMSFN